ncbi:MAG: hypothetical protein LRY71_02610, partial [Bacillaceae bacterium]|nr:hypothetical protein [Bacillaceae bacterium]
FNSLITVWIVRSSTPWKKEISAPAFLIMQMLFESVAGGIGVARFLLSECSVTGTIVNFFLWHNVNDHI